MNNLPVVVRQNVPVLQVDRQLIPALIADLGEQASWRYAEFFTANIRNPHTGCAYARANGVFRLA